MPLEQRLDELRDELPEVWVQPVDVLRPLALGQVALRPGEIEVELAVESVLRRCHRPDHLLRISGVSYLLRLSNVSSCAGPGEETRARRRATPKAQTASDPRPRCAHDTCAPGCDRRLRLSGDQAGDHVAPGWNNRSQLADGSSARVLQPSVGGRVRDLRKARQLP